MKKLLVYLSSLGLLFSGCIKLESPEPKTATQFKNLKVSESFSWQTTRSVKLAITGTITPNPVRATLLITNKQGDTLRRENRLMDENVELMLQVPTTTDSLIVSFGSIQKTYKVQSEILANYILPITDEEN
ncbi:MAG: hypothetical protein L6Q78_08040 [Bacteroidia bacterium]|nr:hypothetical protein [Bacteroidia bacterium]